MNLQKKTMALGVTLSIGGILAAWSLAQVSVAPSEKTVLPADPLQFIDSAPTAPAGTLLYIASVPVEDERIRQRYLVLHQSGAAAASGKRLTYRVAIPESVPEVIFDSQFVDDGRSILFKAGWPYDNPGYYHFYLWNLTTNKLEKGPPERLAYTRLFTSPKGDFIAYYRGGDSKGNEGNRTRPLTLFIYNRVKNTSVSVVENSAAKFASWTTEDTLLYSVIDIKKWYEDARLSADLEVKSQNADGSPYVAARPDVYEVSSSGENPQLVLKDGYQPIPSPDNKWIAFFTSTDEEKKINPSNVFHTDLPRQSYLCLYNRATKKRHIIQPVRETFPQLKWMPDSRHLLTMSQTIVGAKNSAKISILDVSSRVQKEVVTLKATDAISASHDLIYPQFEMLDVSEDGAKVMVKVAEIVGQGQVFMDERNSFQSIDIRTGKISLVAQVFNQQSNSLGMDWHFGVFPLNPAVTAKS